MRTDSGVGFLERIDQVITAKRQDDIRTSAKTELRTEHVGARQRVKRKTYELWQNNSVVAQEDTPLSEALDSSGNSRLTFAFPQD